MFKKPKFKKVDNILYKGFEIPIYSDGNNNKYAGHPFIEGGFESVNKIYDVNDISGLKNAIYMISKNRDVEQEGLFPKPLGTVRVSKPIKNILRDLVKEEITKYLNEYDSTTTEFEKIPLGDNFEYGKYESSQVFEKIKQLRSKVEDGIKKNPNTVYTFEISAGESQVTNPPGFEVPGSLALVRGKQVKIYIDQIFGDLIKQGKVQIIKMPETVNDIVIGKTPYRGKGSGDNKNPKLVPLYKKEQFVNLLFGGRETTYKIPPTTGSTGNTITGKTYQICNFTTTANGSLAESKNDFLFNTYPVDVSKIEDGQKFKIVLSPRDVPDLLYVKAGGKEYNTGFVGSAIPYYSIMLATILHYTYTRQGKSIPKKFPQNIVDLDITTAHDYFDNDSGLQELLGHVVQIGWSKKPKKNVDRIEWKIFDKNPILQNGRDDLFKNKVVGKIELVKDPSMKSVIIEVYSPVGSTLWELATKCID